MSTSLNDVVNFPLTAVEKLTGERVKDAKSRIEGRSCVNSRGETGLLNQFKDIPYSLGEISFWIFMCVATIVSVYRYAVQVNELKTGSFFNSLKRPSIMIPNQLWSWIWVIMIYLISYATYRLVVRAKTNDRAARVNGVYYALMLNLVVWTVSFFDHRSIYSALFVGIVVVISSITIFLLSYKRDSISTIIFGLFVIWSVYITLINYEYLRLNPRLESFPNFPDLVNAPFNNRKKDIQKNKYL